MTMDEISISLVYKAPIIIHAILPSDILSRVIYIWYAELTDTAVWFHAISHSLLDDACIAEGVLTSDRLRHLIRLRHSPVMISKVAGRPFSLDLNLVTW